MPASNVQELKEKFEKGICELCKGNNCELPLHGFPSARVILDVDCIIKSGECGKRCDFIIVVDEGNDTFLLPIEFKSGSFHSTKVKEQLEGCITYFGGHTSGTVRYCPIHVSIKIKDAEYKNFLTKKVKCNGGEKRIMHVDCGDPLYWNAVLSWIGA